MKMERSERKIKVQLMVEERSDTEELKRIKEIKSTNQLHDYYLFHYISTTIPAIVHLLTCIG